MKEETITFRMSTYQKKKIIEQAKKSGYNNISLYIRELLTGHKVQDNVKGNTLAGMTQIEYQGNMGRNEKIKKELSRIIYYLDTKRAEDVKECVEEIWDILS